MSSDSVPINEKRICHLVYSAVVGDAAKASALTRSLALSFLVGGLSASAYFLAVFLDMPSFRAIGRQGVSLPFGLLYRLPASLLGLGGYPVQPVAKWFLFTAPDLDGFAFNPGPFFVGRFQGRPGVHVEPRSGGC